MEDWEFDVLGNHKHVMLYATATDDSTKTVLYGYTTERETHHVYQEGGNLHVVVYKDGRLIDHTEGRKMLVDDLVPNKRLYPESCDFDFCLQLQGLGVELPFTTFDKERAAKIEKLRKPVYGLTETDLMLGVSEAPVP